MSTEDEQANASDTINLLLGWPSRSLLPADLVRAAANAALSDPSIALPGLLYGPDPGYEPAREAVADWLTSFFRPTADAISAERMCITGGASQSLGCLLSSYTDPEYTRNIWIVAPAYYLAFCIFEDAGFANKMRAVPEDEDGVSIAYLEKELQKSEQKAHQHGNTKPRYKHDDPLRKVYKHVVYCVPTFSNPSSRTMTIERRRGLVRLARKYDVLVVCDDVYDVLQWPARDPKISASLEGAHVPRVVDVDRDLDGGAERDDADGFGNACSNGSFSKILGPGARCGWVEGTKKFAYGVSQTGTQRSGGAPSQLTSTYITHLLKTGQLQQHIRHTLQPAYARRYATLMEAIETHMLPLGFRLPQPGRDVVGGYFLWIELPASLTAQTLAKACLEEESVIVAPGERFEVPRDEQGVKFDRHMRLCWAWEDEWKLSEGPKRIARVTKSLLEHNGHGDAFVIVEKDDL